MQENQVQERTVYVSPALSLDSVPAKRMVKIPNPVYVLLARQVITKTERDKQVVFRAFQASIRMKKKRSHANHVRRIHFQAIQNGRQPVTRVLQVAPQMKEASSVPLALQVNT
jgi:hypothetical protein